METELEKLVSTLNQHVQGFVMSNNVVEAKRGPVSIWITAKPPYCDRWQWMVQVDSNDISQHIDDADGFPRYYFHAECMAMEIKAWLKARELL